MFALQRFADAEKGAVTIDWVALAAGLLVLGIGMISLVAGEVEGVVDEIETQMAAATDVDDGHALVMGLGNTGDTSGVDTPEDDAEAGPDAGSTEEGADGFAGSLGGEGYYGAACSGGACYMDTTGDGFADRRYDGNSVADEPGNIRITDMLANGGTPPTG